MAFIRDLIGYLYDSAILRLHGWTKTTEDMYWGRNPKKEE